MTMTVEPTPPPDQFGLTHNQDSLIAKLRNMSPELLAQIRATTPDVTTGTP